MLRRENFKAKQDRDRARILNFLKSRSGGRDTKTTSRITNNKHHPMSLTVRKTLEFLRKNRSSSSLRGNALRHLHQQIRILKQSISIRRNRQRGLRLLLKMARLHNSMFSTNERIKTSTTHSTLKLKTLEKIISSLLKALNWNKSKVASLWSGIHQFHEGECCLEDDNALNLWNSERRNLIFF